MAVLPSVQSFTDAPDATPPFPDAESEDAGGGGDDDDAARRARDRVARMERFQRERAKRARAMDERRRLEKEHAAALRAGAFLADDADGFPEAPPPRGPAPRRRGDAPPPAAKKLSNRRALTNALSQICLAGPHCANQLNLALEALDKSHADNHIVVLKDDSVHTFRGLYALHRGRAHAATSGGPFLDAQKIYGRGPLSFAEDHVMKFLKFNSAARAFTPLPSKSFSFTTDAVVLNAAFRKKPPAAF